MPKISFKPPVYNDKQKDILRRMAAGNPDIEKWLEGVTLTETQGGYYLAWHRDFISPWEKWRPKKAITRVAVLEPDHEEGEHCEWLESDGKPDIRPFVDFIESGRYAKTRPSALNLFILEVRDKNDNLLGDEADNPAFLFTRFIDYDEDDEFDGEIVDIEILPDESDSTTGK